MIIIPDIEFPTFPGVELPTDPGSSGISLRDAQNIALLYEAGLNRQAELGGLNYWIDQFEAGMTLNEISQFFLGSSEFADAFGVPTQLSNEDLVQVLPTLYPGEQQLPSGEGLSPPSQPHFVGMEPNLPARSGGSDQLDIEDFTGQEDE